MGAIINDDIKRPFPFFEALKVGALTIGQGLDFLSAASPTYSCLGYRTPTIVANGKWARCSRWSNPQGASSRSGICSTRLHRMPYQGVPRFMATGYLSLQSNWQRLSPKEMNFGIIFIVSREPLKCTSIYQR